MKGACFFAIYCVLGAFLFPACGGSSTGDASKDSTKVQVKLKEENVPYKADTINANGFVVYDENNKDKRPAILVVHEWWGMNDYAKSRARQLAALGYVAFAVDMYGNGKTADNPTDAGGLATPFYKDPSLAKTRLDAAIELLKQNPMVDTNKIAAIGYCFGGFVVLNAAKQGADLAGVVSFHGNLSGVQPDKNLLKSKVLVCHGAADPFVSKDEVASFRKGMDSIGANYTFIAYDSAVHAFTNPKATEMGKKFNIPVAYNEAADKKSWEDMKAFFIELFK